MSQGSDPTTGIWYWYQVLVYMSSWHRGCWTSDLLASQQYTVGRLWISLSPGWVALPVWHGRRSGVHHYVWRLWCWSHYRGVSLMTFVALWYLSLMKFVALWRLSHKSFVEVSSYLLKKFDLGPNWKGRNSFANFFCFSKYIPSQSLKIACPCNDYADTQIFL